MLTGINFIKNTSLFFPFYEATDPVTPPASRPLLLLAARRAQLLWPPGQLLQARPLNPDGVSLSRNPFAWSYAAKYIPAAGAHILDVNTALLEE